MTAALHPPSYPVGSTLEHQPSVGHEQRSRFNLSQGDYYNVNPQEGNAPYNFHNRSTTSPYPGRQFGPSTAPYNINPPTPPSGPKIVFSPMCTPNAAAMCYFQQLTLPELLGSNIAKTEALSSMKPTARTQTEIVALFRYNECMVRQQGPTLSKTSLDYLTNKHHLSYLVAPNHSDKSTLAMIASNSPATNNNCCFHSVKILAELNGQPQQTPTDIRKKTIQHMRLDDSTKQSFLEGEHTQPSQLDPRDEISAGRSYDDYCEQMGTPGTYVDHRTANAAISLLRMANTTPMYNICTQDQISSANGQKIESRVVGQKGICFVDDNHYVPCFIAPKKQNTHCNIDPTTGKQQTTNYPIEHAGLTVEDMVATIAKKANLHEDDCVRLYKQWAQYLPEFAETEAPQHPLPKPLGPPKQPPERPRSNTIASAPPLPDPRSQPPINRVHHTDPSTQNKTNSIVDFYTQQRPNVDGVTIHDMWNFNDDTIEKNHQFIQWMFPSDQKSKHSKTAPLLTRRDIDALKKDPHFLQNLKKSTHIFMSFLGFNTMSTFSGGFVNHREFEQRLANWQQHPHNDQRITRMLRCLVLFGEHELAADVAKTVNKVVRAYPGFGPKRQRSIPQHIQKALTLDKSSIPRAERSNHLSTQHLNKIERHLNDNKFHKTNQHPRVQY